jgi:hypothetical protein
MLALKNEISYKEFLQELQSLNIRYYKNCEEFRNWTGFFFGINNLEQLTELTSSESLELFPFMPSSSFKHNDLMATSQDKIIKVINSSGTSSGMPSKIFLDKKTSELMEQRLRIDTNKIIGSSRRHLFIVEEKSIFRDRKSFAARGAAIAGLLKYGKTINFLFEDGQLNLYSLNKLKNYHREETLIIGTTVNIWTKLLPLFDGININLSNAIVIHGGGWKNLENLNIDNVEFKKILFETLNVKRSINFFGMVEQLGSVSYECINGNFHVPDSSIFLIKSEVNGLALNFGEVGLLQVNSILPNSYPGASILTDDLGMLLDPKKCNCGNINPIFEYKGRVKKSEIRGCGAS